MFFATTAPSSLRRQAFAPAGRSLERFLAETQLASRQKSCTVAQDETSYQQCAGILAESCRIFCQVRTAAGFHAGNGLTEFLARDFDVTGLP